MTANSAVDCSQYRNLFVLVLGIVPYIEERNETGEKRTDHGKLVQAYCYTLQRITLKMGFVCCLMSSI